MFTFFDDYSIWQLTAISLIFVWSGFVRTAIGFGGAALSLPLLLFFVDNPLTVLPAIAFHLLFFSVLMVGTHFERVNWPFLRWLLMVVLIPKLLGLLGLLHLPATVLAIMIYLFSFGYGLMYWFGWTFKSERRWLDIVFVSFGGYLSGVSLVGAPPIVAVAAKYLAASQLRETLMVLWFILVVLKVGAFIVTDTPLHLDLALWLLPFAFVGHYFGQRVHAASLQGDKSKFMRQIGAGLILVTMVGLTRLVW